MVIERCKRSMTIERDLPHEDAFQLELDAEQAATARDYERRWFTLGVLCLSLVMIVMANSSLNVALPTLATDLHAGSSSLQWIVDAYSLVFAGLLLTAGALGDRYGRRLALNGGLVVFGLASAYAVMSTSATGIIAARATMGLAAAFVMPATLSILAHVFPPNERPRAIAIWAGFAGLGVAMGGVISGALLENFWWGSIFLINVFVVIVALVAGVIPHPRHARTSARTARPVRCAALDRRARARWCTASSKGPTTDGAPRRRWSPSRVALVILAGFIAWELHTDEPMLDLRFFHNPRFTAATAAITLVFFAMFGAYFIIAQYMQFVRGYSPLGTGLRMLPWALAYMVSAMQSGEVGRTFRSTQEW